MAEHEKKFRARVNEKAYLEGLNLETGYESKPYYERWMARYNRLKQ